MQINKIELPLIPHQHLEKLSNQKFDKDIGQVPFAPALVPHNNSNIYTDISIESPTYIFHYTFSYIKPVARPKLRWKDQVGSIFLFGLQISKREEMVSYIGKQ